MNTKDFFGILLMAMFAVVGLTACSNDDEPKDSVKDYVRDVGVGRSSRLIPTQRRSDSQKELDLFCYILSLSNNIILIRFYNA